MATPAAISANPDRHDQGRDGGGRHEHEPGEERAEERAGRAPRRQSPDRRPRGRQIEQLQLDHRRWHGAEHRGRREEAERGQHEDPHPSPAARPLAEHPHDRDRRDRERTAEHEQHGEQSPRIDVVGGDPTHPRADGDPGEDRADDPGERLEADTDVGREQPAGEDLEDEHRRRGPRHQRDGEPSAERSRYGCGTLDGRLVRAGRGACGGGHRRKATSTRCPTGTDIRLLVQRSRCAVPSCTR